MLKGGFTPTPKRHGCEPVEKCSTAVKRTHKSHGRKTVVRGFTKVFENKRGLAKFVHKNGMTVIFRVKKEAESVTLGIGSRAGLVHHPLTHLIHHMLFKGTAIKSGLELKKEAARIGDTFDACTDFYSTLLFIRVTPGHIRRGFQLLYDMIKNPAMEKNAIEKEKHVVTGEIKRWSEEPQRALRRLIFHALYARHPARDLILENPQMTATATSEEIKESHQKFYHAPQRLVVVAVGKFSPAKLLQMIERCFGGLSKSIEDPFGVPEEEYPKSKAKPMMHRWHGEQTHLMFGFRAPLLYYPDYFPMRLLSAILGEGLDSRLYTELREKTGLVHVRGPLNPTSELDSSPWHSLFYVYAPCDPQDLPNVEKIIRKEWRRLSRELVDDEELRINKAKLIQWRALSLAGTKKHAQLLFTAEISGMLEQFDRFPYLIRRIKAPDIRRVARKYCASQRVAYAILEPSKKSRD